MFTMRLPTPAPDAILVGRGLRGRTPRFLEYYRLGVLIAILAVPPSTRTLAHRASDDAATGNGHRIWIGYGPIFGRISQGGHHNKDIKDPGSQSCS